MHTNDNTAETQHLDPDLDGGNGAVDNDAYGADETKPETTTTSTKPETEENEDGQDDGQTGQKPAVNENDGEEEDEFYWDGAPLASPTSTDDGEATDTPLVKQLRQTIKDQRKALRDKNIALPDPGTNAAPQALTLPPKPKMEDDGIDYDPEVYQQKVDEWYTTKAQVEQQQAQQTTQQQKLVETFNEKKAAYKERIGTLKVRNYEDAEAFVAGEISQEMQSAIILHSDRPEHVVLALARNPDLMKQMKGVSDPVTLGVLIGTIQAKAKAMPKGKSSVKGAPSDPRGAGKGQTRDLDVEIDKARNSGDYTRVIELKRQKTAAQAKK